MPLRAAAADLCPSKIETKQQLDQELKGWESWSRNVKHRLKTVLLFYGHPSKQMALKYDEIVEQEAETVYVWHLDAEAEYWVQCEYSGTDVVLARRAPRGVTRCEATWLPGGRGVKRVRCG